MATETYDHPAPPGADPAPIIADPAPLGLAAFALTTFVLSVHNAGWAPDVAWIGLALFYGGLAQLLAGMWEFRNKNAFGATAFASYGGFWLALGSFVLIAGLTKLGKGLDVDDALGWFLLGFTIFNSYMLLASALVNKAVFGVFLTLEVTEILLVIGFMQPDTDFIHWGGYIGVVTAAVAWYASFAGVANSLSERPILPVGSPIWSESGERRHRPRIHRHGAQPT
ncbi:MAG TPA: acetate uptake transporter [Gaiellales bacterium]|nr:acetate uptake transporter [Gaiellales bacterium]